LGRAPVATKSTLGRGNPRVLAGLPARFQKGTDNKIIMSQQGVAAAQVRTVLPANPMCCCATKSACGGGERCRAMGLGGPDLKLGVAPTMRSQRHPWRGAPDASSMNAAGGLLPASPPRSRLSPTRVWAIKWHFPCWCVFTWAHVNGVPQTCANRRKLWAP